MICPLDADGTLIVSPEQVVSSAEMERVMKVQEVILKAMAGSLKFWEAAEIIGVSDRTMRRWRERYQEGGYDGLYDRRKRRPSPKRVPLETAETVLQLYREKYFDCNMRHFYEKLTEEHGIRISYTWVKQALQGTGLVSKQRRRGKLTTQFMLHVAPHLEPTFLDLFHAAANHLPLLGRQRGVVINQSFCLDQHPVGLSGKRHEIPLTDVEGFKKFAGNHHLPALPHAADLFRCG